MTDRPIIFSAPMVRALLDGRKTQTRRLASSPLAKAQAGDRLWVRETWSYWPIVREKDRTDGLIYRATDDDWECRMFDWRPSIHMPRWASRLTLIVEAVKVERLQDISEADAAAEGMSEPTLRELGGEMKQAAWSERQVFARLWGHLHGAGAWDANPHVVAITFRVERGNIDRLAVAP